MDIFSSLYSKIFFVSSLGGYILPQKSGWKIFSMCLFFFRYPPLKEKVTFFCYKKFGGKFFTSNC